ncbi:MAG: helical backbone metal receptor [Halodesulfurarchaeum sp.]
MTSQRVVSLAPSATQTIEALGGADAIVAATEHSTAYPSVGQWLTPDLDRVAEFDPDLVILADALQDDLDTTNLEAATLHVDPRTLTGVFESILSISRAVDAAGEAAGLRLINEMAADFTTIARHTPDEPDERPVVYSEEWSTPPMVAGNWVPEIVEIAGGTYPFVDPGTRSRRITVDEFEAARPEVVLFHICGDGSSGERPSLEERGWTAPAVESGECYTIEDSLLNQPGPRLVEGAAAVARILHGFEEL